MDEKDDFEKLQDSENRVWWRKVIAFWATLVLGLGLYASVLGLRWCSQPHCAPTTSVIKSSAWNSNSHECSQGARMETETFSDSVVVRCTCPR